MDLLLKALKSKTVQFSIALAVLSILQAMVGCIIASCVTVLRFVTTTGIADK